MNTCAKWVMVLLVVALGASCSISKAPSPRVNYTEVMSNVKAAKTARGIPRAKVFYHFRLYGVPSTRWMGGARGGYSSQSENWNMLDGHTLSAYKHRRVTYKIVPLKKESLDRTLSFSVDDEKYYHEPPLEPYFDTLILTDRNKKVVGRIDLPYR